MIAICVEEKADEAEEEAERKDIKPSSFEALYKEFKNELDKVRNKMQ
jgi:hypothetical protein